MKFVNIHMERNIQIVLHVSLYKYISDPTAKPCNCYYLFHIPRNYVLRVREIVENSCKKQNDDSFWCKKP